ncbi:MAG: (d)CMP kinase [Pseudomonadota bacterium]
MSVSDSPVIAIDGPSGSGKGTAAARVAQSLGWHLLDSGALYRLTGLAAIRLGVALSETDRIGAIARNLSVRFVPIGDEQQIFLDEQDVTLEVRTEQIGDAASKVAALQPVRDALLDRQRAFATAPGLVADGRDMGTVVFPEAALKIYLTASAEERAQRRYKQLLDKNFDVTLRALLTDIERRDARDQAREAAPLRPADDAVIIDSSDLDINTVVSRVLELKRLRFDEPQVDGGGVPSE